MVPNFSSKSVTICESSGVSRKTFPDDFSFRFKQTIPPITFNFRFSCSRTISGTLSIYIFVIANTTCILCLIVFRRWCYLCINNVPNWLSIILIILSNDVHLDPGPQYQNSFFNFMSWNVNSMANDNFERGRLIKARNSTFNYDMISICETSLNDSVELPETLLNDYTFVSANNPANTRHGGMGLFLQEILSQLKS